MAYLTAIQAATRLGKSEKTIRRWITEGRLKAKHRAKNRYAIAEQDVDELAKELAEYEQQDQAQEDQSQSALLERIATLEQDIDTLKQQIAVLTAIVSGPGPKSAPVKAARPRRAISEPLFTLDAATPEDLPAGSLLSRNFAELHGVNVRTFYDQIVKGARGERVDATERPKPNRPKEIERWLTPDQQEAALAVWKRNGTRFTECPDCPHAPIAEQDQEKARL